MLKYPKAVLSSSFVIDNFISQRKLYSKVSDKSAEFLKTRARQSTEKVEKENEDRD